MAKRRKDPKRVAAGKKAALTRKRRQAARKAAATRKRNQLRAKREHARRSGNAKRGWVTRRKNEEFARRSAAAKKGVETRRRNELKRLQATERALKKAEIKNGSGDIELTMDADMPDHAVKIRILEEKIKKACSLAAQELAEMGAEHARAGAPVRTGQLRNSIRAVPSADPEVWYVAATAPHARIRHTGSKKTYPIDSLGEPTVFYPGTFVHAPVWNGVRAKRQPGPGRSMYYVIHRGSKASPYMRNAAAFIRAEGGSKAARIVRSAV